MGVRWRLVGEWGVGGPVAGCAGVAGPVSAVPKSKVEDGQFPRRLRQWTITEPYTATTIIVRLMVAGPSRVLMPLQRSQL